MNFSLIQLNQLMQFYFWKSYECGLEHPAQLFLLLHFMQSVELCFFSAVQVTQNM